MERHSVVARFQITIEYNSFQACDMMISLTIYNTQSPTIQ